MARSPLDSAGGAADVLGEGMRRRRSRGGPPARAARRGERLRIGRWLLAGLLFTLLALAAGYALAVFVLFPERETAEAGIEVPDLSGQPVARARSELARVGLELADSMALVHPRESAGVVIGQTPLPGQQLRRGAGVSVAVSSGPARVRVPNVIGLEAGDAVQILRQLGFETERFEEESLRPRGEVLRVAPDPGTELEVPDRVTLVLSLGPPPDTAAVDTLAPPPLDDF